MKKQSAYLQPEEDAFQGRKLDGILENVDYTMNSNLRIWYNNQKEGYPAHQHNAVEVVIPAEEPYTVIVQNTTFKLIPGDILLIPQLAIHEILRKECGSRFILMFNMEPLTHFHDFNSLDSILMDPRLITPKTASNIYEHVYSQFMQITELYFSAPIFWEYSVYSALIDILITIGREHYHSGTYQKFTSLLAYIDCHYAEGLTLEQMASYTGFSKYHFARLFKEHTNITFYDYLCRKRIQAAKALLSTNRSLTEIAFQTGFNNSTSFCRCFKKYNNYSPSEYRRLFISDDLNHLSLR